eukprot:14551590-Alexandrium_andersonii.AAC.1
MWRMIQKALRSRGWRSVKATKIKAHLDRQAQERGEISPWHRFGTEAADMVAGRAMDAGGSWRKVLVRAAVAR